MSNNKQSMKLYTENDLIDLVQSLKDYTHESHSILGHDERDAKEFVDIFLKDRTFIELPSDEEIKKYTPYPLGKGFYNPLYSNKWEEGAKWMRNKIQGGDK